MRVIITADLVKRAAMLADLLPQGSEELPDERVLITFDSLNEKIIISTEDGQILKEDDY